MTNNFLKNLLLSTFLNKQPGYDFRKKKVAVSDAAGLESTLLHFCELVCSLKIHTNSKKNHGQMHVTEIKASQDIKCSLIVFF